MNKWLWIYENHTCELRIKSWMKAIFENESDFRSNVPPITDLLKTIYPIHYRIQHQKVKRETQIRYLNLPRQISDVRFFSGLFLISWKYGTWKKYYLLICFDHFLALIPITIVNLNFLSKGSQISSISFLLRKLNT